MANALATTKKDALNTVRGMLEKMKPQFALALPKHLTPDRLLRVAISTISVTPKLLECDRMSLYGAIMSAAQLGLEPDGVLGSCYLVPFKNRVQLIVGYKGYIQLARNSGEVRDIRARAVFEKDSFTYAFGLEERLVHVPALEEDRGKLKFVYAIVDFKDGGHHFEVMHVTEVDAIRKRAPGGNSDAWNNHYEQMALKTAIRRLAKFLPLSVQKAAALDDAYEQGKTAAVAEDGGLMIDVPEDAPEAQEAAAESQAKEAAEKAVAKLDLLAKKPEMPVLSDQTRAPPVIAVPVEKPPEGRLL